MSNKLSVDEVKKMVEDGYFECETLSQDLFPPEQCSQRETAVSGEISIFDHLLLETR